MSGFEWKFTNTPWSEMGFPEDSNGWCVRNSICQLFGWEVGSRNWLAFRENVDSRDMERLLEHLHLPTFVSSDDPAFIANCDHPGFSFHAFPQRDIFYLQYQPHVRHIVLLDTLYWKLSFHDLFRVALICQVRRIFPHWSFNTSLPLGLSPLGFSVAVASTLFIKDSSFPWRMGYTTFRR